MSNLKLYKNESAKTLLEEIEPLIKNNGKLISIYFAADCVGYGQHYAWVLVSEEVVMDGFTKLWRRR